MYGTNNRMGGYTLPPVFPGADRPRKGIKVRSKQKQFKLPIENSQARWWFQIFFIFTLTWGNDPICLIFFKWVETTSQPRTFISPRLKVQETTLIASGKKSELVCKLATVKYFLNVSPNETCYNYVPIIHSSF